MKTIFTVLQDIERLIYKILMWIILIPKTVVRITLLPRWASEYVRSELRDGEAHFDEYVSPVILLLVVALLPALGYNALPRFQATLSSPAETALTTDRYLSFEITADFISTSKDLEYFVEWEIWKKNVYGEFEFQDSAYHPEPEGISSIVELDDNTIQDRLQYRFDAGEYLVYARAGNADRSREDIPVLEFYEEYLTVVVPEDINAQIKVSSGTANTLDEKSATSEKNFLDRVKEEQTIFLALALMIPPLVFAFVSKVFKGEAIAEGTLKENFYVQCYYFSPLSLAIWGTYYALYFYTDDAYLYSETDTSLPILMIPLILAVLWFIRTEVKNIAWERNISVSRSFWIVAACVALLGFAAHVLISFDIYMNNLRLLAIRVFPLLGVLLVLGFVMAWYGRRKEKNETLLSWNSAGLVLIFVAFLGVLRFLSGTGLFFSAAVPEANEPEFASAPSFSDSADPSAATVEPTLVFVLSSPTVAASPTLSPSYAAEATPSAPVDTPVIQPTSTSAPTPTVEPTTTLVPLQGFYTEEFDNLPVNWSDFMTYGDLRMVRGVVVTGKLSLSIRPLEDKLGWYYLINNNFSYTNVSLEAEVTNQGNNANGVSLICRYSDAGWYEFVLSNDGTYTIYAVDQQGLVNQGYNNIANGGSSRIRTGRQTNTYTASCNGNALTLMINGTEVRTITDDRFRFVEGRIGLGVSAMQKLPVSVEFESLKISEP